MNIEASLEEKRVLFYMRKDNLHYLLHRRCTSYFYDLEGVIDKDWLPTSIYNELEDARDHFIKTVRLYDKAITKILTAYEEKLKNEECKQ